MAKYQPGWKLLGQTVRRRRDRLGLTQEDVADAGGPSVATLRLIENAQASDPRSKTLYALDDAIAWVRGSAIGLVEGKIPPRSWVTDFDDFVDDLIDYVDDTTREKFNVPVSPRQRRFDMHVDTQSEAVPGEKVKAGDVPAHLRGLAALIPTGASLSDPGQWGGAGKDTNVITDEITDHLELLSLEQLDHVAVAVDAMRRAKRAELGRMLGIPEPRSIKRLSRHFPDPVPELDNHQRKIRKRFLYLTMQYSDAYQEAARALLSKSHAENASEVNKSEEADTALRVAIASYERAIDAARTSLQLIGEVVEEAFGPTDHIIVTGESH